MLKDKKFYPWMVVGMLVVVSLLNYLDRQMLATMRPFIMVDIKELESITNFGRLMAIFLWIYAFMSPISGMIADRLNRKWLIVISLFVWSTVTLMMGYVHDISHLYILRALMGVSEAFYIPAALSLTADYHQGKTRSIAIGVLTSGIYLGQAIGGFGATVAAYTSWQFTFHSFGMIGIIYSFVLITLLHEKKDLCSTNRTTEKHQRKPFNDLQRTSRIVQQYRVLGNAVLFCSSQSPRMDNQELATDHGFRYLEYGYGVRRTALHYHFSPFFIRRSISRRVYFRQMGAKEYERKSLHQCHRIVTDRSCPFDDGIWK